MQGAYFPTVLEDLEDIGVRIEIRRGGGTCEVAEVTPAPRIRWKWLQLPVQEVSPRPQVWNQEQDSPLGGLMKIIQIENNDMIKTHNKNYQTENKVLNFFQLNIFNICVNNESNSQLLLYVKLSASWKLNRYNYGK